VAEIVNTKLSLTESDHEVLLHGDINEAYFEALAKLNEL